MLHKIIRHIPLLRTFIVRPRLALAVTASALLFFALPDSWRGVTKFVTTWDFGTALYLLLAAIMMYRSDETKIQKRAATQDDGGITILALTVFGAVASVAAIMHELAIAKSLTGHAEGQAIGLATATVLLSWLFMQTAFALHYAHEFYNSISKGGDGGLEFPARYKTPDYWDFIYFSYVMGTSAATADVNLTSKTMRRIAATHCVITFFFNTTVLALAINVGASLA